MPAPTVQCHICNQEVTKRSTIAIGNGKRACREHPEAQTAAGELVQQAKDKAAAEQRRQEQAKIDRRHQQERMTTPLRPRCWVCEEEGMRQDEWYTRWLIETQKYELVHGKPANPFNFEEMAKALESLKGQRCLFWVKWTGANKKIKLRYRAYELVRIAEQMMGGEAIMLVCGQCCKEKGFTTMSDERSKEITLEQMMNWAAVYEVVSKPIVEAVARTELEQRN